MGNRKLLGALLASMQVAPSRLARGLGFRPVFEKTLEPVFPRWFRPWFPVGSGKCLGTGGRAIFQPLVPLAILFSVMTAPGAVYGQEIPLERCDTLPVIQVAAAGQQAWFLVDTAATSMLNLESFAQGLTRDVRVTSWSGTLATSAKEVTIGELAVGRTKLVRLKLPAIDLSAIGKACGRKIDGILGVDLLGKIGATIDLKRELLHVTTAEEESGAKLVSEMQRDTERCKKAFNDSSEDTFADCLDTKIVLFTANEEFHGREKVVGYFRDRYFYQSPPALLEIRESAFHPIGDAVWYEYEFTIKSEPGRLHGRGMAMCRKSDGRWRMASMHHSVVEFEPAGIPAWQSLKTHDKNSMR
jgi:ketosteroid isomerase-like protein